MITLDEIAAGAAPASRDEAVALMTKLAAAQAHLAASFAHLAKNAGEDRLLGITEAAEKLGESVSWLRRRTRKLSFVVRLDGHIRYSARGIDEFIAARRER